VDDRLAVAKDMMLEMLRADLRDPPSAVIGSVDRSAAELLAANARALADALLAELHNVPAPSGGPVASPPGSDSPPAVQECY
jgi:hypothetical protein